MKRKIPTEAFSDYVAQGVGRSYRQIAAKFGVSLTAVANCARRENWAEKIAAVERQSADAAAQKAANSLEAVRQRHLKIARTIQARALETLRAMPISTAIEAVRALDISVKLEQLLLGEPCERTAIEQTVNGSLQLDVDLRKLTPAQRQAMRIVLGEKPDDGDAASGSSNPPKPPASAARMP